MKKYSLNESNDRVISGKNLGVIFVITSVLGFCCLSLSFLSGIRRLLIGTFGLLTYVVFAAMLIIGVALFKKRKYAFSKKYLAFLSLTFFNIVALLQLLFTASKINAGFGAFLSSSYSEVTPAGAFMSLIVYPIFRLLNIAGVYAFFAIALVVCVALVIDYLHYHSGKESVFAPQKNVSANNSGSDYKTYEVNPQQLFSQSQQSSRSTNNFNQNSNLADFRAQNSENGNNDARKKLGLDQKPYSPFASQAPLVNYKGSKPQDNTLLDATARKNFILSPSPTFGNSNIKNSFNDVPESTNNSNNSQSHEAARDRLNLNNPNLFGDASLGARIKGMSLSGEPNFKNSSVNGGMIDNIDNKEEKPVNNEVKENSEKPNLDLNNPLNSLARNYDAVYGAKLPNLEPTFVDGIAPARLRGRNIIKSQAPEVEAPHKPSKYVCPPYDLLNTISTSPEQYAEDYEEKAKTLMRTLDEFGIPAKVVNIVRGAAVTRYELQMPAGIAVKRIQQHADDIAMALASYGGIRVEAPIPGKSAVGVEVPNEHIDTIGLKDVLYTKEFMDHKSALAFGIGKDIGNEVKVGDLQKMPHFLVAGATGSGKSVCLNSLIVSMLYRNSPDDLRLILIDPKRVEFSVFNGLPHLMLPQVVTESEHAINAFEWTIKEMDRRYSLFQNMRVKDIKEFNALDAVTSGEETKLPYIVIVVDELADLMLTAKRDIENKISRLAAKSRAAGIHLVIATQRPSVDVITGTIKANMPTRAAFMVTSFVDSKTIIDRGGAEKLLGKGDMLYAPSDLAEPVRVQGAYVSNDEVKSIVDFIKKNNEGYFDKNIEKSILYKESSSSEEAGYENNGFDPILPQALKLFIEIGQASVSMIQRRFSVGFNRAGRIIDQMERAKFIAPSDGSKARAVYMTMEQFQQRFGDDVDGGEVI